MEKIITDEQIEAAWGNANFGEVYSSKTGRREIIRNTLLKCACGYETGRTAKIIAQELGLVTVKWTLTKKGKEYLFAAYSNGTSV